MTAPTSGPLDRGERVYVAGHRGLVGSAVWRVLEGEGFTDLVGRSSQELDLRDRALVMDFFETTRPSVVVLAAARVGGILANASRPHDFLSENLQIQLNVMDAAVLTGVGRLLFLGSSCIYPRLAPQPISESALLTGPLEQTNISYAIAKIAGVLQVQAVREQHGLPWIAAMPTNLYGPGDDFAPPDSHVLAALIARYVEAAAVDAPEVTNWGTGSARREFMHVDDAARACLHLLDHYDDPTPINVGTGEDLTIDELARLVAEQVGYRGRTSWDVSKPDGTPRKLLDVSRIHQTGWRASVSLQEGLAHTIGWYREAAPAEEG